MQEQENKLIRLESIRIENFKAIDLLEIEFPDPELDTDPDLLVIGSRNGVGKTSVLEAIAMMYYGLLAGKFKDWSESLHESKESNIMEYIIRYGKKEAIITCRFCSKLTTDHTTSNIILNSRLTINKAGKLKLTINRDNNFQQKLLNKSADHHTRYFDPDNMIQRVLPFTNDPLILPGICFFHGYRKIDEGSPELSEIIDPDTNLDLYYRKRRGRRPGYSPISLFKMEILRSMLGKANLFEGIDEEDSDDVLIKLNDLIQFYANGKIEKLRPSSENTIEFRISPVADKDESFPFDSLSSGQKEIISTIFLIWKKTRNHPSIVLIDEPELHLNAEWQREFIHQLKELAPWNQYIMATHSPHIFESALKHQRIQLEPSGN